MADLHKIFTEFNEAIKLSPSQEESLRTSRDAVRVKIRSYFKEEGKRYTPHFCGQGSFRMGTIISPKSGEFDIDDGIYLKVNEKPEEAIGTLHRWIFNAVDGHTQTKPIDKNPCVRLIYAGNYHIDLPLYYICESGKPYLAHKSKGWIESDPREFWRWFNDRKDEKGQLKRIVRYLKAWKDHLKGDLPCGLILSIFAAQNIVHDERDDVALCKTLQKIHETLPEEPHNLHCYRPTTPQGEDLMEDLSETSKKYFLERLNSFVDSATAAIDVKTTEKRAHQLWKHHFGSQRFPNLKSAQFSESNGWSLTLTDSPWDDTEEFIEDLYPINLTYNVEAQCCVSQDGFRFDKWYLPNFLQKFKWLSPGCKLKFSVRRTNCCYPYSVLWKIRNTGAEAKRRNQIRGQILERGDVVEEKSLFRGNHFVECYIIKNGVCVARDRVDVPIASFESEAWSP